MKYLGIPCFGEEYFSNPNLRKNLLIRSVAGTIGFSGLVFAIARLPLGIVNIIFNTGPFWASFLGFCIHRERLSCYEVIAMTFSFCGILLLSFSQLIQAKSSEEGAEAMNYEYTIGVACIFTTSLMYAIVGVMTRTMQKTHFSKVLAHY